MPLQPPRCCAAPELLNGGNSTQRMSAVSSSSPLASRASDVFSLGLLAARALGAALPLDGDDGADFSVRRFLKRKCFLKVRKSEFEALSDAALLADASSVATRSLRF